MSCADGTGGYIGMTVVVDAFCRAAAVDPDAGGPQTAPTADAGNKVSETQAFIRQATDDNTVSSIVKVRSMDPYESDLTNFESAAIDDGCGSVDRKRKGCGRTNPPWNAIVEYDGSFPIEALIGAEGQIRRWNNGGEGYREAYGWISGAAVIPNQAKGEESLGRLTFQWEGGGPADRGFPKMYDKAGVEQFPALP